MAARENALQDVGAASLVLHAQNFASALKNVVPKFTSWALHKVCHCIRYANIKVFSELHFPIYAQNPRTYTGQYISE